MIENTKIGNNAGNIKRLDFFINYLKLTVGLGSLFICCALIGVRSLRTVDEDIIWMFVRHTYRLIMAGCLFTYVYLLYCEVKKRVRDILLTEEKLVSATIISIIAFFIPFINLLALGILSFMPSKFGSNNSSLKSNLQNKSPKNVG